jgi:hypothetical protein
MKRWYVAAAVLVGVIIVAIVASLWASYLDLLSAVRHETNRWAVIEDVNQDRMAVEPTSDHIWSELMSLNQNGTRMWVGGIVEKYPNKWGFRFKPDTVTAAQVTAEGLQATIRYLSETLDDWLDGRAYVSSKVVETHS